MQSRIIKQINQTKLNDGSDNKKNSHGLQKGFIHSQEYKFQIVQYANGFVPTDADKSDIRWVYSYNQDGGGTIRTTGQQGGELFIFKADSLEMCGKVIKFEVSFVKGFRSESTYTFEIFYHYRFRFFNRNTVEYQIKDRLKNKNIKQGKSSLCGMAVIFYLLAKKDPSGYAKLAKELHRKGSYHYKNYTIEPHHTKLEMYDRNPNRDTNHPKMDGIDWITMATARTKESDMNSLNGDWGYSGRVAEDASAINWPGMLVRLGKKLLGYSKVEMDYYKINKSYIRDQCGSDEKVRILEKDINRDFNNSYQICLLIDADMVRGITNAQKEEYTLSDPGDYHWVVYEGGLQILNKNGNPESDYDEVTNINFKVFSWGKVYTVKLSKMAFITNYYGYLRLK